MKADHKVDPVLPDQGGRMMPTDPGAPEREEAVRRRAYELYLSRGCKDGYALKDWADAETQISADALETRLNGRS